jgi:hypothetical protein
LLFINFTFYKKIKLIMSDEQKGFGGIFGKLGKLIFTEDYLEQKQSDSPESITPNVAASGPVSAPANATVTSLNPTSSFTGNAQKDMIAKVHALVDNMNKPGIDFLELWDAAEAMGGVNQTSISNAFTALKIASGNTLTKQTIISTGESYCTELQNAINSDVQGKQAQKNQLVAQQQNDQSSLTAEVDAITKQIQDLQNTLAAKKSQLESLARNYAPKIQDIDAKISNGQSAVQVVLQEMNQVLALVKTSIPS